MNWSTLEGRPGLTLTSLSMWQPLPHWPCLNVPTNSHSLTVASLRGGAHCKLLNRICCLVTAGCTGTAVLRSALDRALLQVSWSSLRSALSFRGTPRQKLDGHSCQLWVVSLYPTVLSLLGSRMWCMSWSHGHVSSLLHTSYFSLSPAQALSPSSPLPFGNGALSHVPDFLPWSVRVSCLVMNRHRKINKKKMQNNLNILFLLTYTSNIH